MRDLEKLKDALRKHHGEWAVQRAAHAERFNYPWTHVDAECEVCQSIARTEAKYK